MMSKKTINKMAVVLIFLVINSFCFAESESALWDAKNINPIESKRLYQQIESIIQPYNVNGKGKIGISAINLKTGQSFSINGNQSFFMASTYKIAIATQLLTLVDKNKLSLNQMIPIALSDYVPGSGIIIQYFNKPGLSMSVLNLLALMLQQSDNTATDLLLNLVGGPKAVTERLKELGINDMRVDRPTLQFSIDAFGLKNLPPKSELTIQKLLNSINAIPQQQQEASFAKFMNDPRDNTTPNAMIKLLSLIYQGKALQPNTTKLLLQIMNNKSVDTGRLFLLLPSNIWIAQKLGTGNEIVNDVGIIKLPNNAGAVVVAIYTKFFPTDELVNNEIPAKIARTLYDFFLFNTASIFEKTNVLNGKITQ